MTTEVIESTDDIDRVIEIYRKRWAIEELFKAIKTGCRFESHQLEDIKDLLITLSIESAIAWQLLRLRWLSRKNPDGSGRNVLSESQYQTVSFLRNKRGVDPSLVLTGLVRLEAPRC